MIAVCNILGQAWLTFSLAVMAGDTEGGVTEMLQVEEESEEEAFKQAYAVVYADNEAHFKPKAPDSNIEFDNKDLPPEKRKWID